MEYTLVKVNDYFYNLTFMKMVKKRSSGEYKLETGDTFYGIPFKVALNIIAHKSIEGEKMDLKSYIKEFQKHYKKLINEYN